MRRKGVLGRMDDVTALSAVLHGADFTMGSLLEFGDADFSYLFFDQLVFECY